MTMPQSQGWYYFEDEHCTWVYGMSKNELAYEIRKHGKLIKFVRT